FQGPKNLRVSSQPLKLAPTKNCPLAACCLPPTPYCLLLFSPALLEKGTFCTYFREWHRKCFDTLFVPVHQGAKGWRSTRQKCKIGRFQRRQNSTCRAPTNGRNDWGCNKMRLSPWAGWLSWISLG